LPHRARARRTTPHRTPHHTTLRTGVLIHLGLGRGVAEEKLKADGNNRDARLNVLDGTGVDVNCGPVYETLHNEPKGVEERLITKFVALVRLLFASPSSCYYIVPVTDPHILALWL
jgi:hypothetical protein